MPAHILTDLGFGDSGKGTMVDYLCRTTGARLIVRTGGCQAAHHVITPDGREHTFNQFGSGSFVPGTHTHLSDRMTLNMGKLDIEATTLDSSGMQDPIAHLTIDENAPVITPFHVYANKIREMDRNHNRHGSCAQGIGDCMSDYQAHMGALTLFAGDLCDYDCTMDKLERIRNHKLDQLGVIIHHHQDDSMMENYIAGLQSTQTSPRYAQRLLEYAEKFNIVAHSFLPEVFGLYDNVVFEGSQGVLLDEWYGFHPHTTWLTTTNEWPHEILRSVEYEGIVQHIGVLRAYTTRHGPGPLPTEDGHLGLLGETTNHANLWQRYFRVGHFDAVLAKYALDVVGPIDELAITCVDRLYGRVPKMAIAYEGMDLHHHSHHSLGRQADVGLELMNASPIYRTCGSDPLAADAPTRTRAYIDMIAEQLDVPVSIMSTGPTANDKTELPIRAFEPF